MFQPRDREDTIITNDDVLHVMVRWESGIKISFVALVKVLDIKHDQVPIFLQLLNQMRIDGWLSYTAAGGWKILDNVKFGTGKDVGKVWKE
jgi:hypothetical protein